MADTDDLTERFREDLGPDFEYLADGVAPVVKRIVEQLVSHATAPLRHRADQVAALEAERDNARAIREAGQAEAKTMAAFSERHPDWKDHQQAIAELSQKWSSQGMTQAEYLDHLYTLVTADARHEAQPRERDTTGADDGDRQADTPRSTPTFAECFRAAKRGERWE
jgi:predicted glycoside hydrolase/deacetylase ChbG (UPF0249 family)